MNNTYSRLFFGCMIILLWACSPAVQPTASPQEETSVFYADFEVESYVYHDSDDSSTVFLRMPASYLTTKKWNNTQDFKALHLTLDVSDSLSQLTDHLEADYHGYDVTDNQWIIMKERLKLTTGVFKIIVEISDANKKSVAKEVVLVDKKNKFSVQNFLIRDEGGEPLFGYRAPAGSTFTITSDRNATADSLEIFQFAADTKLPPPPFSTNSAETPLPKQAVRTVVALSNGQCTLTQQGLYQCMRITGSGYSFLVRQQSHSYPSIDLAQQLHYPLRYITTKAEYDEMNKLNYSKNLVDKFWIESGGTRERSRELISKYYTRVEECNRYFTSFTEGWRTDRGMIYLVYGPPILVEHADEQEVWHYNGDSDENEILFVFNRVKTPIGLMHFQLKRDPYYKTGWEMMVNAWRNGRVR
ncbi:MAG: hypothetical protein RLZZ262_2170 [Bacteroidota bacterium]|jgi:GWxTD domain-containing protein